MSLRHTLSYTYHLPTTMKYFLLVCANLLLALSFMACGNTEKETTSAEDSIARLTAFQPGTDAAADSLSYALGRGYSGNRQSVQDILLEAGTDSAFVDKFLEGLRDAMTDDPAALAYSIGYQSGIDLRSGILEPASNVAFGRDSTRELSVHNFLAGFFGELYGKQDFKVEGKALTQATAGDFANDLLARLSDKNFSKAYAKERKAAEDFMAAKAQEPDVCALDGGVLYRVIKPGSGPHPTDGNVVTFHYEGRFIDGTVFDKESQPETIGVKELIMGFAIALKAMPLGAKWEIYIPWQSAYGAQGTDDVPPFSTLIYKVELLNFE